MRSSSSFELWVAVPLLFCFSSCSARTVFACVLLFFGEHPFIFIMYNTHNRCAFSVAFARAHRMPIENSQHGLLVGFLAVATASHIETETHAHLRRRRRCVEGVLLKLSIRQRASCVHTHKDRKEFKISCFLSQIELVMSAARGWQRRRRIGHVTYAIQMLCGAF